ncbi:hypothetical protein [Gordonia sp. CPCC 205333]|uniref:hypothetical protein n=1 Tax=Gordonia sp. CPCC 205333 TaxID=3140790 RepID=UPI003AF3923D
MSSAKIVTAALGIAAAAGASIVVGSSSPATAASVQETRDYVWVGFTPSETKQIAHSGVSSIFSRREVHPYFYAQQDRDSVYKSYFVPGRGYVVKATVQKLVDEAAHHPNGRVWVSYNKHLPRPITIWTQF